MHCLIQKWRCFPQWESLRIFSTRFQKALRRKATLLAAVSLSSLAFSAEGQANGVYREIYSINGSSLLSLTNETANFLVPPSATEVISGLFEGPPNYSDHYGDRYRALLVPPVTGTYVFWVQGDDAALLYLSSDESPLNKVQISINTTTALSRAWYVYPSQQSTNIFLEAGRRYYLEAIHSAGTGDDAFAVGWKLPNGMIEQPMPTTYLYAFGIPGATNKPAILTQPTNVAVFEQSPATFHVGVSNFDTIIYQWQRNGTNLPGSLGASLTISPTLTNDNNSSFRCVLSNSFGAVTSATVLLTVTSDTTVPIVVNAANLSSNVVQVVFSEPVQPASATNIFNYSLNNGANISSASFGSSTRVVLLTASGLQRGSNYTLTVNNIRDRAAAQNALAANSQQTFTVLLKGIYREIYADIPGSSISDLTNSAAFPNAPAVVEVLTNYFETSAHATNNYGQRLRASIIPPLTGNYTFWVAAHDTATLSLGTNSLPSSARVIASVTRNNGDVSARQWDVQLSQKSAPIPLVAGEQYYIEALMKSGISIQFPPDHLSIRWQLPDGTFEEPISITRLTPVGLGLPLIAQQPIGANIVEGSSVSFSVAVSNLEPVLYQWQKNGTNIANATNAVYTKGSVLLAENGSTFHCVIANALGTTNSDSVALVVTADTSGPFITSVVNNSSNRVVVTFTEPVDPATATMIANYSIPNVTLSAPVLSTNGLSVTLTTTPLAYGSNYTITINGVRDRAATPNTITANSQFTFSVVEFFLQNIGTPAAGSIDTVAGGLNMTAANGDFFGTNDSFNFAYEQRRGDFDVRVRVAKLDFADTWTVASLMAREDLNTASRYAAVCATPSIAGAFFQYRTNTATAPQGGGSFPVNYPYTWLRLERIGGSTFNGYASIDGVTWTKLSSVTLSLPASIYLGFTLSSRTAASAVNVQFRDFGENTSTTLGLPPTANEPLGPSSRRTGLAFTELMYHPAPRADGRKIEFIELYNSNPFYEDISGYRVSGDVSYTFPPGTILAGGAFLVIARNPGDIQAIYGIPNVVGPYTGGFSNKKGTARLRNRQNAILLEVNYDTDTPWPITPDGAGHSLVLAHPSLGEDHPEAWAQSDRIGGSPGIVDGVLFEPVRNVVINEFLAHTDLPDVDYIELYNHSSSPVDLSGCWLSDAPATNKFRIPDGTIIGATGFVYFTEATLGFSLSAAGEAIYFVNSNLTRVVDSIAFDAQQNGVSSGRVPDGGPAFYRLAAKTPGAPNGPMRQESIVINEIMYHPVTDDDNDEFIELYNRGTNAVNVGGWRLNKAIDFTFPTNTIIPTNGYLVIAKNAAHLRTNYAILNLTNTLGDYSGTLANSGERLTLDMPDTQVSLDGNGVSQTNTVHIIVDEVTYGTGGRWGNWSDGGGSSLELIDPHSDRRLPSNWADSDDTAKSVFTTLSATGLLDNEADGASQWNALQLYLLEAGECLVDNVNVTVNGVNLMLNNNGGFESGLSGWVLQGDHRYSYLENTGDGAGHSLHVVAQDRGDTGANRIYKLLTAPYTTNVTGTISARVKWLHGSPYMLLRLRGNMLEVPGVMTIPKNLGTPGARNSRYATNAGPALAEIAHSPVMPAANQPVVVTARVVDPDGVASVKVIYRIDPFGGSFTNVMVDDGTGSDVVAGDGVYSALIPGQPSDTMVAFYVKATDGASSSATTTFPNNAPARECLVHFGEDQPISSFVSYRFWMTQATLNDWLTHEKFSSEDYQGTFVYGNFRAIYNAGSHYAGSPAHAKLFDSPVGTNCDYQLHLPADDALLDETSLRIQEPGLFGVDKTCQNESFGYWLINQMGVPGLNRRPICMFVNGVRRGIIYEDTQRQNSGWDEEWYSNADSELSDLYRVGYGYEFGDDVLAHRNDTLPSLQPFTTTGGVKKLARYRGTFNKRAVKDSPHNYTNLFSLVDILKTTSTGDAYAAEVFPNLDVKEWARSFAAERIINNTDLYGARRIISGTEDKPGGQNAFIFKPGGDTWKFLIWDIDAMLLGTPVDPLFDFTDPPISNLFKHPYVLRTYWQALEDAAHGPLRDENMFPVMDAKYAAFQSAGMAASSPQSMKIYLGIRRDYILQSLSESQSAFALTSNGGNNFTNSSTLVTLTGTAPFAARTITINGVEYPLSWSSVTNWTARVPLTGSTNLFTVRAYDANGNLLTDGTKTISVYFNGPVSRAEDSLVINEIMFQPSVTNGAYVEIFNRSTNTTFGLGGYRLKGVDFDFSPAQIINPLSYLVVVKDAAVFQSAYGTAAEIAGEYSGDLDKDGETLSLVRIAPTTNQADTVISKVKYEIVPPWPVLPAVTNGGVALQLIDASQDVGRASNWDDGGGWSYFSATGRPSGTSSPRFYLWLNGINDVYIDDIKLVLGSIPEAGSNLLRNADFETPLASPWLTTGSPGPSVATNTFAHSGTNSLHLVFTSTGGGTSKCLYQDLASGVSTSSSSNYTISFWYRPTPVATNGTNLVVLFDKSSSTFSSTINLKSIPATPGAPNSVAGSVNPYPLLWINEVQPNNVSTLLDNTGTNAPWIELYNSSTNTIQLGGLSLSKSYTNLNAWAFPAGSFLLPGQFRVVFVDGRPQFSTGSVLHTSFKLDGTNGSIVLSRTNQVLDYINYKNVFDNQSYGSYPDGQLYSRQMFFFPTPGASNDPSPAPIVINEWMASNTNTIRNPANGNKFDDWFELYNFGSTAADLSGYYLTQDFNNKTMWRIPDGVTIAPASFLLCWADGNAQGTNMLGNALHVNFKLSKSGDKIGLYSPAGSKVHTVSFGAQGENVSQGFYPDGNVGGVLYSMNSATPRTNNVIVSNAFAPVLAQPANRVVNEGAFVTFTNTSTDADLPPQQRTYSLVGAPEGAQLDPLTGVFTWQTTETDGPGLYSITVVVSDNGAPPLTDNKTFTITVNESNSAPTIGFIANQSTYAGTRVSVSIPALDADLPAQTFTYSIVSGPTGATVNAAGLFTWTPTIAQAPSTNTIYVSATDSGSPSLSATQSFIVVVNSGIACDGFKGDVSPRGTPNGAVTITDWVQVGRFVAGLSDVSNACELAHADCSPKPCGNGTLTITDWVQAGRYAAGLDPLVLMTDCPPPSGLTATPKSKTQNPISARTLSFTNTSVARGTTNCFSLILESQGNENGLGFSINFDTNLLTFVAAQRGPDAAGAPYFLVNSTNLAHGSVGIAFLLSTDEAFPPGARRVVDICFRAKSGSNTVTTPLVFQDSPVAREISDPNAEALPATYQDGLITLVSDTDFLFTTLTRMTNGAVNLNMMGPAGVWEVQQSFDLSTWQPILKLTNATGQLNFIDETTTNLIQRFYRAVKQ